MQYNEAMKVLVVYGVGALWYSLLSTGYEDCCSLALHLHLSCHFIQFYPTVNFLAIAFHWYPLIWNWHSTATTAQKRSVRSTAAGNANFSKYKALLPVNPASTFRPMRLFKMHNRVLASCRRLLACLNHKDFPINHMVLEINWHFTLKLSLSGVDLPIGPVWTFPSM